MYGLPRSEDRLFDDSGPIRGRCAECRTWGDDFCLATLTEDKIERAGGTRYLQARRPDLYREIVGMAHTPVQKVAWKDGVLPRDEESSRG